jgi:hypothetical protein
MSPKLHKNKRRVYKWKRRTSNGQNWGSVILRQTKDTILIGKTENGMMDSFQMIIRFI